jgi:two-component system chemotaxis response regulator CheB
MPPGHPRRDVIVIGASAGGFEALSLLLSRLPAGFPAMMAITLHRSPHGPSGLAPMLGRKARIAVVEPASGDRLERGHVYLAPPDLHMTFRPHSVWLNRGPKQHHSRPAIDPMFRSAAESFGARVIGVMLTGNLSDGVAGLIQIGARGGLSLAQDPDEAAFPSMPRNALIYDSVQLVFKMEDLHDVLIALVAGEAIEALPGFRRPA